MNVFLANVGNRDIALKVEGTAFVMFSKGNDGVNGEFGVARDDLPKDIRTAEGTRDLSKAVLDSFCRHKKDLCFPIIKPALTAVQKKVGQIDKIVLFATDQPKETDEHHLWDTIESAKLLKVLISTEFPCIKDIKVVPVEFNPSLHDKAYKFIGEQLETKLGIDKNDQVFASIKGGIPAMNSALRERTIQYFGPRAWLVETDEPALDERWDGKEGDSRILSSWPFRRQGVLRLLEDFLKRHDYSAALQLLEAEAVDILWVKPYLQHALARTNLDFLGASQCPKDKPEPPDCAKKWKNSAEDEWGLQRLDDLAHSAQITLERHDYVGFLYRVTTFSESCLRILCWIMADLKVESSRIKAASVRGQDEDLCGALEKDRDMGGHCIGADWQVNQDSLTRIIKIAEGKYVEKLRKSIETIQEQINKLPASFVKEIHPLTKTVETWGEGLKKSVDATLTMLDRFDGLRGLRNNLAHRNSGVSLDQIQKKFPGVMEEFRPLTRCIENKIEKIWKIKKDVAPEPIIPVYDEINKAVIDLVGEMESDAK